MDQTLRELQLAELDILREIKKVCERNHIRYFLASGTMLGAVRHHGFIPWDDDIDLEMPYDDYLRFQEIAQKEMGDSFFIQTAETDPYYAFPYLRVQKKNTTLMREWELTSPGSHRIWIDVFPLADLGGDRDFKNKKLMLKICAFLRMEKTIFYSSKQWLKGRSNRLEYSMVILARKLPEKTRRKIRERLLKSVFRHRRTDDVTFVWTTVTRRIPRNVYDEPDVMMRFEDDFYPVPKGYDAYLKILYKDYMRFPPPEKRLPQFNLFVSFDHELPVEPDLRDKDFDFRTVKGQQ